MGREKLRGMSRRGFRHVVESATGAVAVGRWGSCCRRLSRCRCLTLRHSPVSSHRSSVGSKAGAVATGSGSRSWPEAFAIFRCLSPSLNPVSNFRHVVRSMRISRTRLSSGIMRLAHGTPLQPRATVDQLAKAARLPPCGERCGRWAIEPVDASTTPRFSSAVPSLGHVMLPGSPGIIRGNRQSHSRDPSPFGHRSSPEAPFLRRHYPTS